MATRVAQKQRRDQSKIQWYDQDASKDLIAYCPGCKALETVSVSSQGLLATGRFVQRGGKVYHHCGSETPCRLYSLN